MVLGCLGIVIYLAFCLTLAYGLTLAGFALFAGDAFSPVAFLRCPVDFACVEGDPAHQVPVFLITVSLAALLGAGAPLAWLARVRKRGGSRFE